MHIEDVKRVISLWRIDGLKNIRFSGGEPTLYPNMTEAASFARENGVQRIAISTNGSAKTEDYMKLVAAGVNDFSISLDACCAADASRMAGVKDLNWDRLSTNIAELSGVSYVTVGVVLTQHNINEVINIIEFANKLGVADIRIIPAAQWSKGLSAISGHAPERAKILAYRLKNIEEGRNARGMSETDFRRCPLVLDDSAVAGGYHFPCIIYLREGGRPIGKVGPYMRGERREWFKKTNTYSDPICNGNCLDVCVDYNNKWMQEHLSGLERMPPEYFNFSMWRSGSYLLDHLNLPCRFAAFTDPANKVRIRNLAVGWCPGELLYCRPKDGHVGVMWFINDEHGWCHMRTNEFYEVFSGQ